MAALVEPVTGLGSTAVGILSPGDRSDLLGGDCQVTPVTSALDIERAHGPVPVVVVPSGIGPAHQAAMAAARRSGGRVFVVQHGLLTPYAPPLPRDCTLLAWSEADAEFWRGARHDVEVEVVGSQLLWAAARRPPVHVDPSAPPTFLGQLHAAEIARRELARVSYRFCADHGGVYRPHPSETDRLSRLQHAWWQRRGVDFDTSGVPLDALATPVAAIFSTGILEAAAAGRPAWAYHPDPSVWVAELWDRYGLHRWGDEPTPPPEIPATEPGQRIAAILSAAADHAQGA